MPGLLPVTLDLFFDMPYCCCFCCLSPAMAWIAATGLNPFFCIKFPSCVLVDFSWLYHTTVQHLHKTILGSTALLLCSLWTYPFPLVVLNSLLVGRFNKEPLGQGSWGTLGLQKTLDLPFLYGISLCMLNPLLKNPLAKGARELLMSWKNLDPSFPMVVRILCLLNLY